MEREVQGDAGRDAGQGEEDHGERINRELIELLNELRVALPGAQVLLAFLLTVPFMQRFDELDAADRRVYMFAVLAAALGSLLLIAPSAHHRLRFRQRSKEDIIRTANVCSIAGMGLLALAVGAAVYLVADVVYGSPFSGLVGAALVTVTVVLWFVVPLLFFRDDPPATVATEPEEREPHARHGEQRLDVDGQRSAP